MNNNEMLKKIKKSEKDIVKLNEQLDKITTSTMVNVKMFKCDDGEYVKGDGVHDDTTGMQKAHNTGKLVEYPKGIYKFSKLNFKQGGIVGHGKSETVLSTFDTSNNDIITINPTLTNDILDTVLFKNFYLKGVNNIDNYGDKIGGAGIKVGSESNTDQSYFPLFDNVHIRYIPTCIKMINTTTFNVVNCDFFFYRNKAIDYSNDLSPDAGDCGILNNHFFNGSSLKTGVAIYQTNAGGLRITNNKFNGGSNAYKCEINDITSDLLLIGNSIENVSDYGLRFINKTNSPSKNTAFGNIVISGNQFALNENDIIFEEISNYKDSSYWDCISITGNTFRHYSNGNCITLNTARNFIISSNAFFTASSGIVVNSSCNIGEIGLNTFAYMDKETQIVNNGTNVNILDFTKSTEPSWNEIVLNEGFSYIGTNKPSYRIVNSTVEFRGAVVSKEPGVTKTMFTLPSELAEKFIPNVCCDITSPFGYTTVTYSNKSNYARGEFNWKSTSTGNTFNLDVIKAYLAYS